MTSEKELLEAAEGVVRHWEGRDCGASWLAPLRAAAERMRSIYGPEPADEPEVRCPECGFGSLYGCAPNCDRRNLRTNPN